MRCVMRNARLNKITRVVCAREVSKYARETDRIRARRASHETIARKVKITEAVFSLVVYSFHRFL